jgi:quinol-cytochrome oxidoreductase complex cytochrome b subunit
LMWHIVLLPLGIGVLVVVHVLLVRRHGVVPPLPSRAVKNPVTSVAYPTSVDMSQEEL